MFYPVLIKNKKAAVYSNTTLSRFSKTHNILNIIKPININRYRDLEGVRKFYVQYVAGKKKESYLRLNYK